MKIPVSICFPSHTFVGTTPVQDRTPACKQASGGLRGQKEGQAQKGKLGSAVLERGTSQSPFPWAVVFTVQSGHSGLPSGQIGPREIQ